MSKRRKRFGRVAAVAATLALAASLLAGCSGGGGDTVRFTFSKREAIEFMTKVVDEYNAKHGGKVIIDTSGVDVVSASFVRGNPPDLMLANYNTEVARFVDRCTLSDLGSTEAAATVDPNYQPLLDQYGVCPGRQSALPYSIMAASVIYNKEIFNAHHIDVPTTWDELIAACDKLRAEGVTPFYATLKDGWTVGQGWYDYSVGGSIDVIDFFEQLKAQGADVNADSAASFQKNFDEPMLKMQKLVANYTQPGAEGRAYADGNLAFAEGEAAMYLQGPWAFSEIAKVSPNLQLGTFPLPMTASANDLKVRVNLDLAAMIPDRARNPEGARKFLEYLYQPEIIQAYNESQLGFTPLQGAALPSDPRVAGMIPFIDSGAIYQGPSVLVPRTIPVDAYAQAMALGGSAPEYLSRMDADWARLAARAPVRRG